VRLRRVTGIPACIHDFTQRLDELLGLAGHEDVPPEYDSPRSLYDAVFRFFENRNVRRELFRTDGEHGHGKILDDLVKAVAGIEALDEVGPELGHDARDTLHLAVQLIRGKIRMLDHVAFADEGYAETFLLPYDL